MILQPGEEAYPTVESRRFQGISSMAVSKGGHLWATWHAGPTPGEDKNGTIYITYDYNRKGERMIYMTTFTEKDNFGEGVRRSRGLFKLNGTIIIQNQAFKRLK